MNKVEHILIKYGLNIEGKMPLYISGTRNETLTDIFNDFGFKRGAEIGVEQGVFSEILCKKIPNLTLFGVDPWKAYSEYKEHLDQMKLEGFYEETVAKMKPYDFRIFRAKSEEAHQYFEDGSLDFVYIDGNHRFLNVAQDITLWLPKIKKGGILSGHDYRRNSHRYVNHVVDVINAYTYSHKVKPWFVIKEPVGASSWFFIKS